MRRKMADTQVLFACLLQIMFQLVNGHREHKVHNIVLYPEKHSWCKTTPIKQVVGHPDCDQVEMDNNVCVGACFSYSIPRTEPTAPGEVAPYCDSCQPSTVTWKHITLNCGEEKEPLIKRVEFIENCSCLTCRHAEPDINPAIVPEVTTVDVPQLLNMMSQAKGNTSSQPSTSNAAHIKHNYKLSQLLKLISGSEDLAGTDSAGDKLHALISEMKKRGGLDDELQGLADEAQELGQDGQKVDISKLGELLLSKLGSDHELSDEISASVHRHHQHHTHKHDGPHHSKLIGDTEEILSNPTLDVASHHLKPAVEGSEITYLPQHHHHTHNADID